MQPVICFYESNQFIWSNDYQLISTTVDSLPSIEREYYHQMKIIKINFNGIKVDLFILKNYKLLSEADLQKSSLSFSTPFFAPQVSEKTFVENVESIKQDICAGRLYQMNYTAPLKATVPTGFSSLDYFKFLSQKISCAYRAYLPLADSEIMCLSPELFLKKKNDVLITQPIKGTLISGENITELQTSAKENAELSMIVDLLRNDLNTLTCEKYQDSSRVNFHRQIMQLGYTSHTYSEIEIKTSKSFSEIIEKTFPGGSISGCPKKESLKKISEVENYDRGFYTGSIGWWHGEDFALNIAIRSLLHKNKELTYYTGCGIVFDSDPQKEWQEFLTKCSFLNLQKIFEPVLDTFELTPNGITYLPEHIERTRLTLIEQNIQIDAKQLAEIYSGIELKLKSSQNLKVRVIFDQNLNCDISHELVTKTKEPIVLELKKQNFVSRKYKTTNRSHWDQLLKTKQLRADDILIINPENKITETSIYNIFYKLGDKFYTPPVNDGCLQGVFRAYHIKKGFIIVNDKTFELSERSLYANELTEVELYAANSVRGLKKATLLF